MSSSWGFVGPRPPVRGSKDLDRVLALPRRPPVDLSPGSARAEALVDLMTERLRRPDRPPGSSCGCAALGRKFCVDRLLPAQAWALWEASIVGGIVGSLGVGSGKTLLDLLIATVIPNCKQAVLLVPPGLIRQLVLEYLVIREHFVVPSLILPAGRPEGDFIVPGQPVVHVVPYSRFSRPESTMLLKELNPDLLIPDEAHKLKNTKSTTTGRVLRYLVERIVAGDPCRFTPWSGTIIAKSVNDCAHLFAFALGQGSPLPIDTDTVMAWASALDPSDWPAPMGALDKFVQGGETVLEAVRSRILETRGVVSTRFGVDVAASNTLRERKVVLPDSLKDLRKGVQITWERPDGEELVDALAVQRVMNQLACGFYYRWRFPGKPDPVLVEAWFDARKAWGRELRSKLQNPVPHMDSKQLLANAAERYATGYTGDLPVWDSKYWVAWRDIKDKVKHYTEAVWVDDYYVKDAVAWAKAHKGVVWYEHRAFGEAVAKMAGLPLHDGGPNAEERILSEKGDRTVIASMSSHGTGRNGLQFLFFEQYVMNPPGLGDDWEQLLGRLHRLGQTADEVITYVPRHTPEMTQPLDRAIRLAKFVEGLTSASQRLLAATVEWEFSAEPEKLFLSQTFTRP